MKFLIVFVAILALCAAEKARFDNYRVYTLKVSNSEQLKYLQLLEDQDQSYNFWDFPSGVGQDLDVMVPPHKFAEIDEFTSARGIPMKLKIQNVQDLIDRENPAFQPRNFGWTSYHNYAEITEWLDHMQADFPNVARVFTVGQSNQGRAIRAIEINHNVAGNKGIVVECNIHAREWISSATCTYIINELLRSTDPEIMAMARGANWLFIPVLNPDGFEFTKTDNRMWRKTRRPNTGSTCIGTDPNRNYAYNFMMGGASSNPCSDTYAGPQAFSESETSSLNNYLTSRISDFSIYISVHSYSQLILWPWGHITAQAPDHQLMSEVATAARTKLTAVYGTPYTIGGTYATLYQASGTSHDHYYGTYDHIKIGYTFELRDTGSYGFLLPANQIIPTGIETTQGFLGLYQKAKELGQL